MKASQVALYIFYGLLAYMPVHIFVSTWLGSSLGILDVSKVAKDIFMVFGFLCLAISLPLGSYKKLLANWTVRLIILYGLLTLLMAAIKPTELDAEVLGVVYNTRFLLFFLYAALLTTRYATDTLLKNSIKITLAVAVTVLIFGIIQYTSLPPDAMTNFGYSKENGVLPFFSIDNNESLERIMSTVRDPNTYGSYLVIVGSMAGAALIRARRLDSKKVLLGILTLLIMNLIMTFSRSAWLAAFFAVGILFLLTDLRQLVWRLTLKYKMVFGVLATLAVVVGVFFGGEAVRNYVFHDSSQEAAPTANEMRNSYWERSVESIIQNPLGSGPGTSGPTSFRNDTQGYEIDENYYLQIAKEVGLTGLALFVGILLLISKALYLQRNNIYAVALLASLVGLSFANIFLHIWANETVAYLWWGLAGLICIPRLSLKKRPDTT